MGRDGAEGTTAKASSVHAHGELDHVVGRDAFATILGMGQTGVGQVEGGVKLVLGEGLVGWIDHCIFAVHLLKNALRLILVALFLYMPEVLCLCLLVLQALLMAVQDDVVGTDAPGNLSFWKEGDGLPLRMACHEVAEHLHVYLAVLLYEELSQRGHGLLAHSIDEQVCS